MSESLFQPMHLVWASIIVLVIMWSWEAWRDWHLTRREHHYFRKALFNQYRRGSAIK